MAMAYGSNSGLCLQGWISTAYFWNEMKHCPHDACWQILATAVFWRLRTTCRLITPPTYSQTPTTMRHCHTCCHRVQHSRRRQSRSSRSLCRQYSASLHQTVTWPSLPLSTKLPPLRHLNRGRISVCWVRYRTRPAMVDPCLMLLAVYYGGPVRAPGL